jgi:hypothetical protein
MNAFIKTAMRKILQLMSVSLFTLFMHACTEDPAPPLENEKIQFTFSQPTTLDGGRLTSQLPDGVSLRISITDPSGGAVITDQLINILKMGDSYITEPLELKHGNYKIADFLIVKESEILFSTPKRGSPLAAVVNHALPYSFNVSKNGVNTLEMEVVSVKGKQPEDFGYVSFAIDVVNPFQVSVFIEQNNNIVLTEATAYILEDSTIVKTYSLQAKTNTLSFVGSPEKVYTLKIQKSGYEQYTKKFTYANLNEELQGKPLKVILTPALELDMVYFTGTDEDPVRLEIEGQGVITISGIGAKSGTYTLPVHFADVFKGTYNGEQTFVHTAVTIKGDLARITSFECFGYNGGVVTFSGLDQLTELQRFSPGIKFNDKADFSKNTKLQIIDMFWAGLPEWIVLPKEHFIKWLALAPGTTITQEQVDGVVNNIYNNATKRLIRDGYLFLQYTEEPSADAKSKIKTLQADYGWTVDIEIQE